MNLRESFLYRQTLAELLKSTQDKAEQRTFWSAEKNTEEYKEAERILINERKIHWSESEESRRLSHDQETIIWADKLLQSFYQLPKGTHRERGKTKVLIHEAGVRLIEHPEDIDTAYGFWKSRVNPKTDGKENFAESIKKSAEKEMEKKWKSISPSQLAGLVKSFAHGDYTSDFAHDLLTGYFRGAKTVFERAEAKYKFTWGAVELIEDQTALEKAVLIGQFLTDIVSLQSSFAQDLMLVSSCGYLEDDDLIVKAVVADTTLDKLRRLTSLPKNYLDSIKNLPNISVIEARLMDLFKRSIKKLGSDEFEKRKAALFDSLTTPMVAYSDEELAKRSKWPFNIIRQDPLFLRVIETTGEEIINSGMRDGLVAKTLKEMGIDEPIYMGYQLPQNMVLEVGGDISGDANDKNNLFRQILKNYNYQPYENDRSKGAFRLQYGKTNFKGKPVVFWFRPSSLREGRVHQLQFLETVGYPAIKDKNLKVENYLLSQEILEKQLRFLNRRGVRVPVASERLRSLGYSDIDFHRSKDKISVSIWVNGLAYSILLDKYFNFDFGGKNFQNQGLRDSLHYLILNVLRSILCEEKINKLGVSIEDEVQEKQIVSRMGHLRLLPLGFRYTDQAIQKCFKIEGRDLPSIDVQRKKDQERNGICNPRTTTYVQPVYEREENLPPIVINLPGVFNF